MRTSMHDQYGSNREPQPRRSTFNVSEAHKHTWDSSNLIPVYWDFLYPGEVRRGLTRCFVRLSNPLDYPLMDNAYLSIHWFAVPIRIIWDNFRKFFGERENPGDSIDYTLPKYGTGNINLTAAGLATKLCDCLGLPMVASFDSGDAHALPFRAYTSIYNYWYRDSSIDNSAAISTDDGPDGDLTEYGVKYRGKAFDYFTNLLPNPQRGESVTIGGEVASDAAFGGDLTIWSTDQEIWAEMQANATTREIEMDNVAGAEVSKMYPNTTINELRNAVAIQQFLERDNRAGQLFGDLITAHYGANFLDAKYAPSFIAGGTTPFIFSPIPNTAQNTTSGDDLGDLGAIGTSTFEGAAFTYRAQEPEILMGIVSCRADLSYSQGLNRKWSYNSRYDFIWPEFEGVGDQAVLKKEIFYQNNATDDEVLGYGPRYEEGRIGINQLHGEFRVDHATPLSSWHLSEDFAAAPALNSAFIRSEPPFDRVLKSSTVDNFIGDFHFEMYSTKALSMRGIPGLQRL